MTAPTVRPARPDDAEAIADAHVRGWLVAYRGLVPDTVLDGFSVERRAAFWRDTIAAETAADFPVARTWVVEVAGRSRGSPRRARSVTSQRGSRPQARSSRCISRRRREGAASGEP